MPNGVAFAGALVTESPLVGFDVLLGMDIIALGDLAITNVNGKTWLSFRTPSCEPIDYVAEHDCLLFRGVGRNDPCPCGEERIGGVGLVKKFKDCHGKK